MKTVTKSILEMFRIRAETEPWYELNAKAKYRALLRMIDDGDYRLIEG